MKLRYLLPMLLSLVLLFTGCTENTPSVNESEPTENKPETTEAVPDETVPQSETETETEPETTEEKEELVIPSSNNLQFTTDKEGIYNYCPSIMQMSNGTLYIYYCTNQKSYEVVDYIGCRKGTRDGDGNITWGEEKIVLSPSEGTWDAHHTCDPSVIAGDFKYQGASYKYLMAYLGCTSYDSQDNKIGLAVANSPEGPFTKVGNTPFIDFTMDESFTGFQWGVGQPSLTSIDKSGKVYLFYTRGDKNGTGEMVDEWDLSDLDAPKKEITETLSTRSLYDLNGNKDIMNNADFVYDAENKRFYAVSDCHPNPSDEPNYIASHVRVNYFDLKLSFSNFSWKSLKTISSEETGFPRNHNAGILRDEYGQLTDNGYLTVFYTVSETGNTSLWSYRIYNYNIAIE